MVSGSGSTQITINPSTTLASSTGYYINIDATAFDDASGNSYAGISNSTSLNFAAGDTAAPLLSSSSPSDNATGVSENANIILTFNEAVDIESGNITIKKASDSSTIETISLSGGLVSGSGSTQITINPSTTLASSTGYYINIDATAFDDASSNSYSGISNTTSLNFETGDNFNPILISSSPKTGEKGVDNSPSIILTFDEPVFFGSGNITVKNLKDNSTVETISVNGNQVQGYGPTEIKIDVLTLLEHLNSYYINIDSTAFHDSDNNYYAGISDSTTLHFEIKPTLSPLLKPMVISTIQSSNAIVSGWADFSINNAFSRITWLSMNEGSNKTSHQGIQLRFQDEVIDVFINTPANDNNYDESYLANKISNAIQNTNGTFVAVSDQIKTDAEEIFYNETARLREAVIGNLNPTFEPVMDGWSMWTDGKIIIGKKDGTLKSAKQEFDSQALSLGFDKPMNNDGLIGFVIEIGQNNIDIGDDATNVKSDNYSLSNYSVFRVNRNLKLESVVGIGIFIMDTVRTDGLQKLTGSRRSDQRFFSTRLINDNIYNLGNWKTRPYIMHSRAVSDLGGFSETGGSLALTFNDQKVKDYSAGIGVDLQTEITINNNSIKPFTKLEYNRSSSKTSATMYYNKEGPQYSYTSNSNKANTNWKFKFGSDLRTESGWNGSASFTREQPVRSGEDYQYSNIFSVNLGKRF